MTSIKKRNTKIIEQDFSEALSTIDSCRPASLIEFYLSNGQCMSIEKSEISEKRGGQFNYYIKKIFFNNLEGFRLVSYGEHIFYVIKEYANEHGKCVLHEGLENIICSGVPPIQSYAVIFSLIKNPKIFTI